MSATLDEICHQLCISTLVQRLLVDSASGLDRLLLRLGARGVVVLERQSNANRGEPNVTNGVVHCHVPCPAIDERQRIVSVSGAGDWCVTLCLQSHSS